MGSSFFFLLSSCFFFFFFFFVFFFFFKAREARPAGAKRERLELNERPSAMMRQQDSLIFSSCSSLSYPSDRWGRPPFSTQVAQSNFYFRPNLIFLLTSPPSTSSAKRFFVTFSPL